jgi:hypothetical protein
MDREVRPAQHHSPPTKGSRGQGALVLTRWPTPSPSSHLPLPSGVAGWSSRRAGSQQLNTPPPATPRVLRLPGQISLEGRTSPPPTKRPPQLPQVMPSLSISDMSPWAYRHDTLSNTMPATKKSVSLATSHNCQLQDTSIQQGIANVNETTSVVVASRIPVQVALKQSHLYAQRRQASPSPSDQAASLTTPPLTKPSSPSAPPLAKKTRKRRCEAELLRSSDEDSLQPLTISPPAPQPATHTRLPSPPPLTPRSLTPSSPQTPWPPSATLSSEHLAPTPTHAAPSHPRPTPPSPGPQPSPPDAAPSEQHQRVSTGSTIPEAPPYSEYLPLSPYHVICRLCFRNSHSIT